MRALATVLVVAAACDGEVGTVSVTLTTAPGSTVLDSVQTLRMEITSPRQIVMAQRTGDGFSLALELPATGGPAAILVDGFDADGNLVANGASPRFAFGGVTGEVAIYMAAPDSVDVAPVALEVPRSELGVALLPYGAAFIGGAGAAGTASDAIEIYNAFDHSLASALALPGARAAPAVAVATTGIYIFGGRDEGGAARATMWRFDPSVSPAGAHIEIGEKEGFARAGESFVPLGGDRFLLTGAPPGDFTALDGTVRSRSELADLPSSGVTLTANDGITTSIFADESGVVRFRGSQFETLATPGRAGAVVAAIGGGKAAVVCGTTEAQRIDAASGAVEPFPGVPTVAKTGCAVAATARHLLVAGGTTVSGVDGSVEVYDTATLALVTATTLAVPRTGATAVVLPNNQILIAGGLDATGSPVATLELFTPTTAR